MKVYILYQTDVWKTYGSRVCFGVYSSDKLAREYAAKEKLKKEIAALPEWLSSVPGLNLEAGVEHCETADDFIDALSVFAASISEKAGEISQFFEQKDWQKYTLKVHSLKSMSRVIGAEELGELSAELEIAGKSGDIKTIEEKTPQLLREYTSLRSALSRLLPEEASGAENTETLEMVTKEILDDAYTTIAELAAVYDTDSIRLVLDSLKKYRLSAEDSSKVNAISTAVSDADWEILRNVLENR